MGDVSAAQDGFATLFLFLPFFYLRLATVALRWLPLLPAIGATVVFPRAITVGPVVASTVALAVAGHCCSLQAITVGPVVSVTSDCDC